ncbi:MAG TPA: aminotransferase, partial [Alphaproteobacteria bacterium]
PAVISNLYGAGFPTEFEWTGTRDYSAVLAVPAALAFWRELGPAAARDHMASLAAEAAATLSAAWDSEAAAPPAMCAAMAAVRAPVAGAADYAAARALRDRVLAEHRIEVAVNPIDDSLWVRVSAHVYNSPDQYLRLAEALR